MKFSNHKWKFWINDYDFDLMKFWDEFLWIFNYMSNFDWNLGFFGSCGLRAGRYFDIISIFFFTISDIYLIFWYLSDLYQIFFSKIDILLILFEYFLDIMARELDIFKPNNIDIISKKSDLYQILYQIYLRYISKISDIYLIYNWYLI